MTGLNARYARRAGRFVALLHLSASALLLPSLASADPGGNSQGCFLTHMEQAIQRNQGRMERYARLSDGRSKKISDLLILAEKISQPTARRFDRRAEPFQKAGMKILCEELVDVSWTPDFHDYVEPVGEIPEKFIPSRGMELTRRLLRAIKAEDFAAIERIAADKLRELEARPSFNCLMRNDLTTILKTARLAPLHEAEALELGLPSPRKLSLDLVRSIAQVLLIVDWIDRLAFPIQRDGIAIICQDFPASASPH